MRDQAEDLRLKMLRSQGKLSRSLAVVSGKGGVGKSNFTINFAYALRARGKKVLIIDMDIGMGNIHILLGMTPKSSLKDYLSGIKGIEEIVNKAPEGLDFIAGGSGLDTVMEWSELMFDRLIIAFEQLQKEYDFILFDMGAGATQSMINLLIAVDEIIVISTMEPTSITDAYSMMKFIYLKDPDKNFQIVSNRVQNNAEGNDSALRLQYAMMKFLSKETLILGSIPEDAVVHKAVLAQKPYLLLYPRAAISRRMAAIADTFIHAELKESYEEKVGFLGKLRSMFKRGRD